MNIYVFGSPFITATLMTEEQRLIQVKEARRVMAALHNGNLSDPRVAQYKGCMQWLKHYALCLEVFKKDNMDRVRLAQLHSSMADKIRPIFQTSAYFKLCDEYFGRNMDIDFYFDTETEEFRCISDKIAPKSGKISLLSRFVEKVKKFIDKTAERL